MSDIALYRKYRPDSFDVIKGQDVVTKTLGNQIINGLTKQAYLFVGQRGTGKTTTARVLAKSLCCTGEEKPCGKCHSCMITDTGMNDDIRELDAASNNSVDDIRMITDDCKYKPRNGNKRVYIIDEVHMLSTSAFNALLKILEEPPEHVVFILATTEFSKVPETIVSRCQIFTFKPIGKHIISDTLASICNKEKIEFTTEGLSLISEMSGGSMRDAISMLDQCSAYGIVSDESVSEVFGTVDETTIKHITEKIFDGDIASAIDEVYRAREQGKELAVLAEMMFHHFLEMFTDTEDKELIRYMNVFGELSTRLKKERHNGMIMFEIAIVKACTPEMDEQKPTPQASDKSIDDVDKRLQVIEKILHLGVYSNPHYLPPDFMNLPEPVEEKDEDINIDMSKFVVIQYGCAVPIPVIYKEEG